MENTAYVFIFSNIVRIVFASYTHTHTHTHSLTQALKALNRASALNQNVWVDEIQTVTAWPPVHQTRLSDALAGSSHSC